MRHVLFSTSLKVGLADFGDDSDVEDVLEAVDRMLSLLHEHRQNEDRFVHPAAEDRIPGITDRFVEDHDQDIDLSDEIQGLARQILVTGGSGRVPLGIELHEKLNAYIGIYLGHLYREETVLQQALWDNFTDEELLDIETEIVASLPPAKDHVTFSRAAAIIRTRVPSTRFLIVGDGPLRPQLEERVRELGLSDAVVFAGHRAQIAPFIGTMDAAVLSSCDHEGCSNFLLEAMGLARPIVATDIGGNCELFASGEAGLFVEPGDAAAMASATLRILTTPQLADEFGSRGRAVFERRFTLPTMIKAYEDLYTELWALKADGSSTGHEPVTAGEWR